MPRISVKSRIAGTVAAAAALGALGVGTAHAATTPATANVTTHIAFAFETPNHSLAVATAPAAGAPATTKIVTPPNSVYSAPALIQNPSALGDEVAIAVEGPNHTLRYYTQSLAPIWPFKLVGVSGSTYSAPSISQYNTTRLAIAAEGALGTLKFYYQVLPGTWTLGQTVPGSLGTTVGAPSIVNYGFDRVAIATEGLGGALIEYWNTGAAWSSTSVAGLGSAVSPPSLANSGSQLVLASQGLLNTLHVYRSPAPGAWLPSLTLGGVAHSAPSVTASTFRYNVAVQGAGHSLLNYHSFSALSPATWSLQGVAGGLKAYSAPSSAQYGTFNLITVAGLGNAVHYYDQLGTGPWSPAVPVPGIIHS